MMANEIATVERAQSTALQAESVITDDNFARFTAFLDAKPATVKTYTRALRQLARYFADNGIAYPGREDILAYRDYLTASGHKATTVANYLAAAKLFFQWTEAEGIYPNIAAHVKGVKVSREHKKDYLTSSQLRAILGDVDRSTLQGKRDYAIVALMATGGLRTIEVARADIGDLRALGDATVLYLLGKGRDEKAEYVKLSAPVERAIREYLKARGETDATAPLFASLSNNSQGKRMSTRSISAIAKSAMEEAGYSSDRLTAHSLRHSAVTIALLNGRPLEEVQQFARHRNVQTTLIYSHAIDLANNKCSETISASIF